MRLENLDRNTLSIKNHRASRSSDQGIVCDAFRDGCSKRRPKPVRLERHLGIGQLKLSSRVEVTKLTVAGECLHYFCPTRDARGACSLSCDSSQAQTLVSNTELEQFSLEHINVEQDTTGITVKDNG